MIDRKASEDRTPAGAVELEEAQLDEAGGSVQIIPSLKAGASEVLMETVTMTCEIKKRP